MSNDAEWCRAMAATLRRSAEARRDDNDVYTAMRAIAFDCEAVALLIDSADEFLLEGATAPGLNPTNEGANP